MNNKNISPLEAENAEKFKIILCVLGVLSDKNPCFKISGLLRGDRPI
jgi:hypothetical protein